MANYCAPVTYSRLITLQTKILQVFCSLISIITKDAKVSKCCWAASPGVLTGVSQVRIITVMRPELPQELLRPPSQNHFASVGARLSSFPASGNLILLLNPVTSPRHQGRFRKWTRNVTPSLSSFTSIMPPVTERRLSICCTKSFLPCSKQ